MKREIKIKKPTVKVQSGANRPTKYEWNTGALLMNTISGRG